MAKITCGPIVGLVTTSTANVLLEVDQDMSVEMVLTNKKNSETVKVTTVLKKKVPGLFLFKSLEPDSTYTITTESIPGSKDLGRVRTIPDDIKRLGIGVVSCDRPESLETHHNLWEDFYNKALEDDIHVVLHIGDNVYIDGEAFADNSTKSVVENDDIAFNPEKVDQTTPYIKARKVLRGLPKEEWASKREEILEIYRDKYREVFGAKAKSRILANFSNLMILDDHDIRDNIGHCKEDSDPESREYFLAMIALQTYHEYQRQLWDPDVFTRTDELKSEFYALQIGPANIIMTDTRLPDSLYKPRRQPGDTTYFGYEQTEEMMKNLAPVSGKRVCLLVCTMPLIFMKKKILQTLRKAGEGFDDIASLISEKHSDEIEPILKAIDDFKTQVGPAGDAIVLAGDLHIGGFLDIIKKKDTGPDDLLCRQIITSPINNKRMGLMTYAGLSTLTNFVESFGDYTYKHYDWTKECNYAFLNFNFGDTTKLSYNVKLITPSKTELRRSEDLDWDKGARSCPISLECCEIL